jgi:hypothetical protein
MLCVSGTIENISTVNVIKPFTVLIISRTHDEQELNEGENKADLKK